MSSEKKVSGFLVSKTDLKGKITYCNQAFIDISGFSEAELLGKPHNIVRHSDMPRSIFAYLWKEISNKREVNVYVKNHAKDGGYYWVFANVTPSFNTLGEVVGYYSVRRKPNPKGIEAVTSLYAKIREVEQSNNIEAGLNFFKSYFENLGQSYENFILHLQLGDEVRQSS